jgi:glycerol-3-phosphate dehydrogenase (NAD(P)+)
MSETIAVVGAGNMGTAVAQVLASNGHAVRAWSIETDVLEEMRDHHLNTKYLSGVELHPGIEPVWELENVLDGVGVIVLSVPSQIVARMASDLTGHLTPGQIVLNVAKGLEARTNLRLSEVIWREVGDASQVAVGSMGGPAIAVEMARGAPMAVIVGMADANASWRLQRMLQNEHLKVETTPDICGLEFCSTLKNVYAIALGICDGMALGANTKAFVGTIAIDEMSRISAALGGRHETVHGLAGLGDLLTTGYSQHSRNRTLGEMLGSGGQWKRFLTEKTVEGVVACAAIKQLVTDRGLALPLLDTVDAVLCERDSAVDAVTEFFRRFSYG